MQVPERRHSFTARARREQIVEAAIDVIARSGYRATTFQAIAAEAQIKSTRTISYHFTGRDELIAAVVDAVFETIMQFMSSADASRGSAAADLEDRIRATVALNAAYPDRMQALMSIFLEHHPGDGFTAYGTDREAAAMSPVEQILVDGQSAGEFTTFDTAIMAATIQRSLDGIAFLVRTHPDLDLQHYANELVSTFRRATRL